MDFGVPFLGNPNITRQGARAGATVPKLSDYQDTHNPLTAFMSGLFGNRPDEIAGSVLDGSRQANAAASEPGFALGTAINVVPALAGVVKGLNALGIGGRASTKVPSLGGQLGAIGDVPRLPRVQVSGEPTLRDVLIKEPYTMKSIEALPDTSRIPRQALLEQSFRKDLSAPELQTLKSMLLDSEGQKYIKPDDLMFSLADKTAGKYELNRVPKLDSDYADFGLSRIGRTGDLENNSTNLYNFHNPHGVTQNHFSDPNNFGHTRTFDEGGVRHVAEVQSDYSQMRPSERKAELVGLGDYSDFPPEYIAQKVAEATRQQEYAAPLTKIAMRRLADEEIASAVKNPPQVTTPNPEWLAANQKYRSLMRDEIWYEKLYEEENRAYGALHPNTLRAKNSFKEAQIVVGNQYDELQKLTRDISTNPPKAIRFATPDTVAKVEGWQQTTPRSTRAEIEENISQSLASGIRPDHDYILGLKELLRTAPETPTLGFVNPGHQSLYKKYEKELIPHLEKIGGKPYTDPKGFTWIEVPLNDNSGRVQLFSVGAGGTLVAGTVLQSSPSESAQ